MLPAVMQILHFAIIPFRSLIHLSVCQMVCLYEMLQPFHKTSIMSVCQSVCRWEKMSVASPPLPFLSMSACVSVRIHHASLGVDQGENTSLFLPALPPPALLALI